MQNKVKKFNDNKKCHIELMPTSARLLDIQSELGELAKEYLKGSNYGCSEFQVTASFKEEYGDVLYALLSLACEIGINSEECLDVVLQKLNNRMLKNNSFGSGR